MVRKTKKEEKKVNTLPQGMFEEGKWYTITMMPCDDMQYFKSNSLRRLTTCYKAFNKFIKGLQDVAEFELFPELSKRGRYHVHGKIKFTDVLLFHLVYAHKLYLPKTSFEVDVINDKKVWCKYCHKDEKIMKPACERLGLEYPITHKSIEAIDLNSKKDNPPSILEMMRSPLEYGTPL